MVLQSLLGLRWRPVEVLRSGSESEGEGWPGEGLQEGGSREDAICHCADVLEDRTGASGRFSGFPGSKSGVGIGPHPRSSQQDHPRRGWGTL